MLKYFFKLIPFLVSLMSGAEQAYKDKPKSGAFKKEMVVAGAKVVTDVITDVAGGQANELDEPISQFIDASAAVLFNKDSPGAGPDKAPFPHTRLD